MSKLYTAKDFLKTQNIISFSVDDTLSKAIAALSSSHDAAFVVDDKNVLLGAVNPYYAEFQGRFPPETKLKRSMSMPPKLSLETPLPDILRNMLESKIYFLPVLDEKDVLLGIVSFRRMLKTLIQDKEFLEMIQANLRPRPAQTVTKDISISNARTLLKKGKLSRMPVVDTQGSLIGLITRFDLREALNDPVEPQRLDRKGQKVKTLGYPIQGLMKKNVITERERAPVTDLIEKMRLNRVGSVVQVNASNKPVGIVAYRDIIKSLLKGFETKELPLVLKTPAGFMYREEFEKTLRENLDLKFKSNGINTVEGNLTSGKDLDNSDKWFELSIRISSQKGMLTAKQRALGWRKVLKQTIDKLAAQY